MKTASELLRELNFTDESDWIEAKRASDVGKSILETICAFANEPDLGGGYLLLGAVRKGFNIRLRPQIEKDSIEGKTVIVVKADEASAAQKPVFFEKRGLPQGAYRRIGPTDQKCTEEDMPIFYSSADTFETTIVKGSSLDDIDENALSYYRKLRKQVK